jgi:Family of unknown function (DUF6600)
MSARCIAVALLALGTIASSPVFAGTTEPPPIPAEGLAAAPNQAPPQQTEPTPPRVSYLHGQVSFWRPGAAGWAPARLNMPLAPGDSLYTGSDGTVEIQVGPRAFVRAAVGTQIGIDNQEPDYIQLRVTAGYVGVDLRALPAGSTIELDTPNAAYSLERAGYYRADVDQDSTALATYRGGNATMTLVGGSATRIEANQQVVVTGTDSPRVALGATPALTAWDQWGYQRSAYLLQAASQQYVAPAVYGTEALDQYGGWRTVETYGHVWVPTAVPAGWAPYSTGRWVWDPRFGWTWLDDAPWGWAPYHYGRWVFIGGVWAWAPGPVVVRPVYAPALVVFLGGPTVVVGRPLYWAPLAWGEPVIPWWGRPGFIGRPWWGGWGGPRVVNNVVIAPTTTVSVTNITVYRNVTVTNAVVGVPVNSFGHGTVPPKPVNQTQVQQLTPVPGPVAVTPVPASVVPATGSAPAPPPTTHTRSVVATRPPHQGMPTPQQQGLPASPAPSSPPAPALIVPAPKPGATPPPTASAPSTPAPTTPPPGPAPAAPAAKPPAPNQGQPAATPPPSQAPPSSPSTQAPAPPAKPSTTNQGQPAATPPSQAPSSSSKSPPPAPPSSSSKSPPPAPPSSSSKSPPPAPPSSSSKSPPPAPSPSAVPAAPPAKPPSQGQPATTPPPPPTPPGPPKAMTPAPRENARPAPGGGAAPPPHTKRATPPPPPPAERPSRAPAPAHEPPPRS